MHGATASMPRLIASCTTGAAKSTSHVVKMMFAPPPDQLQRARLRHRRLVALRVAGLDLERPSVDAAPRVDLRDAQLGRGERRPVERRHRALAVERPADRRSATPCASTSARRLSLRAQRARPRRRARTSPTRVRLLISSPPLPGGSGAWTSNARTPRVRVRAAPPPAPSQNESGYVSPNVPSSEKISMSYRPSQPAASSARRIAGDVGDAVAGQRAVGPAARRVAGSRRRARRRSGRARRRCRRRASACSRGARRRTGCRARAGRRRPRSARPPRGSTRRSSTSSPPSRWYGSSAIRRGRAARPRRRSSRRPSTTTLRASSGRGPRRCRSGRRTPLGPERREPLEARAERLDALAPDPRARRGAAAAGSTGTPGTAAADSRPLASSASSASRVAVRRRASAPRRRCRRGPPRRRRGRRRRSSSRSVVICETETRGSTAADLLTSV